MNKYYSDKSFWKFGEWQITAASWGVSKNTHIFRRSFIENVMDDTNFETYRDDYIELGNMTQALFDIGNDEFVIVDVFRIFTGEVDNYHLIGTNNVQLTQSQIEKYWSDSYTKDANNWIDLYDKSRYNERLNRFEYEWTDYSRVNYESWYQTSLSLGTVANLIITVYIIFI